jgi:hypothetical protein
MRFRDWTAIRLSGVAAGWALSTAKPAVAQTVGFGPGKSKMLDFSMGID